MIVLAKQKIYLSENSKVARKIAVKYVRWGTTIENHLAATRQPTTQPDY